MVPATMMTRGPLAMKPTMPMKNKKSKGKTPMKPDRDMDGYAMGGKVKGGGKKGKRGC